MRSITALKSTKRHLCTELLELTLCLQTELKIVGPPDQKIVFINFFTMAGLSRVNASSSVPLLLNLSDLPDVPLDKVISYLSADDLRAFHQVSKSWKGSLENRPKDNARREKLVECLKRNKENISSRSTASQHHTPASVSHRVVRERVPDFDAKKCEDSPVLMECTNLLVTTPSSFHYASTPDSTIFQTPNSRFEFQVFQEAEKSLGPGQRLFQCRRCRGPVPSPPVKPTDSREPRRSVPAESTRCKLTTRMILSPEAFPGSPPNREYKKAKTLSTADLSPIVYSPPVTVASLGEKMTNSLVLSSPCLRESQRHLPPLFQGTSADVDIKRSTSCSSITGIDLPNRSTADHSSINLSLNLSVSNLHSPANLLGTSVLETDSRSRPSSCTRSCCARIDTRTSRLSDSNLSFDSESNNPEMYEFTNMVPSPSVPVFLSDLESHSGYNIERGRNFQDFSNSEGALSISSFQFQRSIHNSTANDSECNPILQCPNVQCGYRFCSGCEEHEHPGRSCHVLSSDNFESPKGIDISLDTTGNSASSFANSSSISEHSRDVSGRKKNKSKHKDQKKSLRRIAKGP